MKHLFLCSTALTSPALARDGQWLLSVQMPKFAPWSFEDMPEYDFESCDGFDFSSLDGPSDRHVYVVRYDRLDDLLLPYIPEISSEGKSYWGSLADKKVLASNYTKTIVTNQRPKRR